MRAEPAGWRVSAASARRVVALGVDRPVDRAGAAQRRGLPISPRSAQERAESVKVERALAPIDFEDWDAKGVGPASEAELGAGGRDLLDAGLDEQSTAPEIHLLVTKPPVEGRRERA
jgi:hypothetical protein